MTFKDYIFKKKIKNMFSENISDPDGDIEIEFDQDKVFYKIKTKDNEIKKQSTMNFTLPGEIIVYLVFQMAKKLGIEKPSHTITQDGEIISIGTSIPSFDNDLIEKYEFEISKYV